MRRAIFGLLLLSLCGSVAAKDISKIKTLPMDRLGLHRLPQRQIKRQRHKNFPQVNCLVLLPSPRLSRLALLGLMQRDALPEPWRCQSTVPTGK